MIRHIRLVVAATGLAAVFLSCAVAYAAAGDRPAPGRYRMTSTLAGEKPHTREECMDADDIAEAFTLPKWPGSCSMTRNVMQGGRIDLAQTCRAGSQIRSGTISGTYSATAYALRSVTRAPELPVALDLKIVGQRVGACPAD